MDFKDIERRSGMSACGSGLGQVVGCCKHVVQDRDRWWAAVNMWFRTGTGCGLL